MQYNSIENNTLIDNSKMKNRFCSLLRFYKQSI